MNRKQLAHDIKTKLLMHFRFNRAFCYGATEVHNSDVIVSDFKKPKHQFWLQQTPYFRTNDPHLFYFAAPPVLSERISAYIKEHKYPYGVISVSKDPIILYQKPPHCSVIKLARRLHKQELSQQWLFNTLVKRMSSEIITLRQVAHQKEKGNEQNKIDI